MSEKTLKFTPVPHTCFEIADYFLAINPEEQAGEGLTNLKIQKLVYYAQGFHLALYDKPLFGETIEAWMHGPVVPVLYHKYKEYGYNMVPFPETFDLSKYSKEVKELLDEIFSEYGQFSAWKLRHLTHEETPWINHYKKQDAVISHKELKSFFKGRLMNE